MGTPWDVANAALFLASDEANFITSIALPVDGVASSTSIEPLPGDSVRRCRLIRTRKGAACRVSLCRLDDKRSSWHFVCESVLILYRDYRVGDRVPL